MRTAIVAGATGLIGRELVQKLILSDQYRVIYIVSRREIEIRHEKIRTVVTDFENISQIRIDEPIDDAFCTLGTTMKQAGSKEQFKKVDYQYVLAFASFAKHAGARKFLFISSMGASPKSATFYSKVKGLAEEALIAVGFNHLVLLRPSLLLGKRVEVRNAEKVAAFFMNIGDFLIPDNYKAIPGEKVAEYMLKMALAPENKVTIVQSGQMLRS